MKEDNNNQKPLIDLIPGGFSTSGLQFGTNKLLKVAVLDGSSSERNEPPDNNSDLYKFLNSIELNHLSIARKIGLSPDFIQDHSDLLNSGEPVRIAIEKGHIEFANELLAAGYKCWPGIFIRAIRENNDKAIKHILAGKFYDESWSELNFWYLLYRGFTTHAETLYYQTSLKSVFPCENDIKILLKDQKLLTFGMKTALTEGIDDIASAMLTQNPMALTPDMVELALDKHNLDFLRKIWTGDHRVWRNGFAKKRLKSSNLWKVLDAASQEDKENLAEKLEISFIISYLLERKLISEVRKVMNWPGAAEEPGVLEVFIQHEEQELAKEILDKRESQITTEEFEFCLDKQQLWLAIDMLKGKAALSSLKSYKIQKKILKWLADGRYCYCAMEMLSHIPADCWRFELTRKLTMTVNTFIKKTDEIVKCHRPILFLVLLAEFLQKIAPKNIYYTHVCTKTSNLLLIMAKQIEDNIFEEEELRYKMCQLDSHGRMLIVIIAENRFYSLLENNDIGSIISKLWVGSRKHQGLLKASTLYRSYNAPASTEERVALFGTMDRNKPYLFQYSQLIDSCSLRFLGQALSTILLVIFYTGMIHSATLAGEMEDVTADYTAMIFLRLSQAWIIGIIIERILHFLYGVKTNRGILWDYWVLLDFIVFLMMIFIMASINKKYVGEGKLIYWTTSVKFNSYMHSIQLFLIWLRLLGIGDTSKTYGPMLRIIMLMIKILLRFAFIFGCYFFLGASVFTSLFSKYTSGDEFSTFGNAFKKMYLTMYAVYDMTIFTEYQAFGAIIYEVYVIISFMLLYNLATAFLYNIYYSEIALAESEHRCVLILEYNKWSWNDNYGLLILLPTPFSAISACLSPFLLLSRKPQKWNSAFSKIFYVIYAIPQFIIFTIITLILVPFVYIGTIEPFARRGNKKKQVLNILEKPSQEHTDESESDEDPDFDEKVVIYKGFSFRRALVWLLIGPFIVLISYFRDLLEFWTLIYKDYQDLEEETEISKVQSIVNEKLMRDIHIVLSKIQVSHISVDEFLNEFVEEDNKTLNPVVLENTAAMTERHRLLGEYFKQLPNSQKKGIISVSLIKDLLPQQSYYSASYIDKARHISVYTIAKAAKEFRVVTGTINIKGALVPKQLITGETPQIKRLNVSAKKAKLRVDLVINDFEDISRLMNEHTKNFEQEWINSQRSPTMRESK